MTKVALLFPGQGSQSVGMGQDLYQHYDSARQVLDSFNQWVDPNLTRVMFEGPEETLKRTLYTQPAILAVSAAAWTVFHEKSGLVPKMAAGHSLGEYGALLAAGVIDMETAAKLVKKRAELMEHAPKGAMAAILGLPETSVEKAVMHVKSQTPGVLTVANYNTAEQFVISGDAASVEAACAYAKEELGAKRALMLPVGGAFHSPLMADASTEFGQFLHHFHFHPAQFPVVTNVDAQLTHAPDDFVEKLADQIQASVRWTDSVRMMMQEGVDTFVEIGPGKVLTGMIKKIYKDATVYNVFDSASLESTVQALAERALV